ncbi:hypothetical protein ThvES_00017730 [Thiovulum sp. ES]|nr:hypothetical protein ThvES_00017730 [Thiovulum sp. ES]
MLVTIASASRHDNFSISIESKINGNGEDDCVESSSVTPDLELNIISLWLDEKKARQLLVSDVNKYIKGIIDG